LVHKRGDQLLAISVSDTGIGIPGHKQGDIFSSFTQVDSSYTKRYGGTGLGLAISRQLAGVMGGSIELESEEGKGSTFTLLLPLIIDGIEETKIEQESAQEKEEAHTASLEILLAEDNPVNQLFLAKYLENAGHHVTIVENGRDVLKALEREAFDLLLMDIQMPEMNGIEATLEIRRSDPERLDPSIPIIALTAYAMEEDRKRFVEAGMDGFIAKPVDFDELKRVLAEAMSRRIIPVPDR
jgi:CheY-like chemotaxis protein